VTHRPAPTPPQREQRKQNLLLASRLARGQALIALDELGTRADVVADKVVRVRDWLSSPLALTVGSALSALVLALKMRRSPGVGLLSWAWPVWQAGRRVIVAIAAYRARPN
jgi:hypothetical protein